MTDFFKFFGIVLLVIFILLGLGNASLKSELRDSCLSMVGSEDICSCVADTIVNKMPIYKKIKLITDGGIVLDAIRDSNFSEEDLYECLSSSELGSFLMALGIDDEY